LASLLAHHVGRFGFVLVGLYLSFELVRVVVGNLISLRKGVVECNTVTVVSETAEIRLGALLLVNGHSYDFYLVVGHANFNLEFVGHHKFVSLN
jgi:hypothetical protein